MCLIWADAAFGVDGAWPALSLAVAGTASLLTWQVWVQRGWSSAAGVHAGLLGELSQTQKVMAADVADLRDRYRGLVRSLAEFPRRVDFEDQEERLSHRDAVIFGLVRRLAASLQVQPAVGSPRQSAGGELPPSEYWRVYRDAINDLADLNWDADDPDDPDDPPSQD